ncbi:hypothetical protein [Vibrio crassostreae]|uniref:hypothetical protein n=1 Tax=Vibrio crassostreae TaxID=246167 RepID=UPI0010494ABD|nr:hypothetical protein [Vibrio crassostreae]TCN91231.1 hypothetical protein EDB51_1359 [Vibrio crassostreae]CAK2060130.1 hypothetical protein VCRA2110O4_420009 [Vibrio crassostreae]CAK2844851.1 hypothetical protein VCRA2110O3_410001 [Vibrio crassostreae]CAK2884907.1 hypothetical protein VCRA2110O2_430009 [Vibrio crassostreae]CAK2931592.1 hypothetical protein VCRA2122O10_450010 [Vibrio crassostreae]
MNTKQQEFNDKYNINPVAAGAKWMYETDFKTDWITIPQGEWIPADLETVPDGQPSVTASIEHKGQYQASTVSINTNAYRAEMQGLKAVVHVEPEMCAKNIEIDVDLSLQASKATPSGLINVDGQDIKTGAEWSQAAIDYTLSRFASQSEVIINDVKFSAKGFTAERNKMIEKCEADARAEAAQDSRTSSAL